MFDNGFIHDRLAVGVGAIAFGLLFEGLIVLSDLVIDGELRLTIGGMWIGLAGCLGFLAVVGFLRFSDRRAAADSDG